MSETREDLTIAALKETFGELKAKVYADARAAGRSAADALAYADALVTYLALAQSNFAGGYGSTLTTWEPKGQKPRGAFPRHALSMTWDFAEVNPFGRAGLPRRVEAVAVVLEHLPADVKPAVVKRAPAQSAGMEAANGR